MAKNNQEDNLTDMNNPHWCTSPRKRLTLWSESPSGAFPVTIIMGLDSLSPNFDSCIVHLTRKVFSTDRPGYYDPSAQIYHFKIQ